MTAVALKVHETLEDARLRVSLHGDDAEAVARLRELIEQAGHEVVEAPQAFSSAPDEEQHTLLTPRELEVLAAIGEGLTNKAIARRLDISLHTVKFHVESLFRKLGARSRTEALAKAAERRVEI